MFPLLEMIEKLRDELVELGMKLGFQDPQVVDTSQKLDELIIKYYEPSEE